MLDFISLLNTIHRPRLLIRAARIGVDDYKRKIHLPRLLGAGPSLKNGAALARLIDLEGEFNDQRLQNDASYSSARHIEVLIAIMAEAQLLRASAISAVQTA